MRDDIRRNTGENVRENVRGDMTDGDPRASSVRLRARASSDTIVMRPQQTGVFEEIPLPEFHELSQLIYDNFGIKVGENKRTLVTGRVQPMLEKYGLRTHRVFIDALRADRTGQLISELANRISTNHTAFYREEAHFKMLSEKILPAMIARKKAARDFDLRIWCAAAATGEEAYTILFTLMDFLGPEYRLWRAGLLATDISATALETAKKGVYAASRVEPVPKMQLDRYFNRVAGDAESYEVKPEVREEITFRRLNLNNGTYPFRSRFDMIFCRNVMIYFSRPIRARLVERLRDWLVPGGVLLVGHSESLVGPHYGLDYIGPAVYARPPDQTR